MAAAARWTMVGVAAALIGAMSAGRAGAASGVTEYLAGLADHERHNAVIQLEPARAGGDELRPELDRIDALWNEGRHEQAIAAARSIEAGGVELALAVSWRQPAAAAKVGGVQVGPSPLMSAFALDSHDGSGHLFAFGKGMDGALEYLRVHLSADHGRTWSQTASYMASAIPDGSIAVVGDFLYVVHISSDGSEVRSRRCAVADGVLDWEYSEAVLTTSGAFVEAGVVSNADWYDSHVYVLAIESSGALRYAWATAAGAPWTEAATGVANAGHSLDLAANQPLAGSGVGLLAAYVGTDGDLWVWRRTGSGVDSASLSEPYVDLGPPRISAWMDHVVVAYLADAAGNTATWLKRSSDGGASWLDTFPNPHGGHHYRPDVTLRRGAGVVVAYQVDESGDDVLYMIHSPYPTIGLSFGDRLRCNDLDLGWGYDSVVERFAEGGWGVLTSGGADSSIYFDQAPLLLPDGFESGDVGAWSASVP